MSNTTKVEAIKYGFISSDQVEWIKIARQIVSKPHERRDDDWMKSVLIGIRSVNDDSCRAAVEILNKQLKKK